MEKANQKRQSCTREFKLSVVSWYFKNGKNVCKTSLEFKVDRKQVHTWVAKEPSIRATKIKKRCERGMAAKFPDMEKHLHTKFIKLKKEGGSIKKWWFLTTGREFLKNCHPDAKFYSLTNGLEVFATANEFLFNGKQTRLRRLQISLSTQLRSFTKNCFVKGYVGNSNLKILPIWIKRTCRLFLTTTELTIPSVLKKFRCVVDSLV